MVMATTTAPTLNRKPSWSLALRSRRRCWRMGKGRMINATSDMMLQTAMRMRFTRARWHFISATEVS